VTSLVTVFGYNLTLTLTIHNPTWAMSLKNTKLLDAAYMFDDQQFNRVQLAEKGDKHPPRKIERRWFGGGREGATARWSDARAVARGARRDSGGS
jgi:hypothetical protein